MKNIFLILIAGSLGLFANAQDTASVVWSLNVNTADSYISSGAVNATNQTSSDSYVIRDYGGMETSQRVYSSGSGLGYWPNETRENLDRYCEFNISPRTGVDLQLTGISMRLGNSGGSNEVRASIYYSTDNFETATRLDSDIVLPSKALIPLDYDVRDSNILVSLDKSITIRVYPWLVGGVASGKYFNIADVKLAGLTTGEVVPELAQVEATCITKISTQTALFQGRLINTGGVTLDSLGIAYGTNETPDTSQNIILVNPVAGDFEVPLADLIPGQMYYVRVFAINDAGVAYSNELSFTALLHLSIPGVNTVDISDLRPTGAVAHGDVFFDGGLEVTMTGFCYSQQVSPTISDSTVNAGEGLGSFSAYLTNLKSKKTYYVRAFAKNSEGVGYGDELEFITPDYQPELNYTVDLNGSADFKTLQEAFDAVPLNYLGNINIYVKKGIYHEKALLEKGKINVHLMGDDRDSTIITWDDYSGKVVDGVTLGTSTSYTVAVDADDFIAQNITFQNTYNGSQAVALRVKGDRMIFQQCKLLGFQDTYYTWGTGRVYMQDCYIEGTVDFIFGSSVAVFKNCEIKSLRNSTITAASTLENYSFGYIFMNCKLTADNITGASLGRPWKPYAQTVFMNTEEGSHISAQGWLEWSGTTNHLTACYAEYNCSDEGYKPDSRVAWSHQLTDEEAAVYTIENIFSKNSADPDYYYDWIPVFDPVVVSISSPEGSSGNNVLPVYPNPCNGDAVIAYELSESSTVCFTIYSSEGRLIKEVPMKKQNPGKYELKLNTADLPSGIYLVKAVINDSISSQLLVKP